jgi:hypothetical protein
VWGADLYVLEMEGLCKVGRSMAVERRLREHRRSQPWSDIRLIAVFEGSGCVESAVLRALHNFPRRGEWVQCTPRDALRAVADCLV